MITLPEIISPTAVYSHSFFSARMPLPPSVNEAYVIGRIEPKEEKSFNRLVASKKLEQFKIAAATELLAATCDRSVIKAIDQACLVKKYTPLAVTIRFYFREMWRRDTDGGIKFVVDAAFEAMGLDDIMVVKFRDVDKYVNKKDPHAEIDVCCLLQQ